MGNGFPVAAVICRKEIAESFKNRDIEFFSTYGGNPMAMAATCTVLDVLEEEKLQQNALEVGNYLTRRIHELCQYPFVGDVRGVGLFQGIEIVKDRESKIHDG
jgi:ethanolamine-phosphate phospho-lyase